MTVALVLLTVAGLIAVAVALPHLRRTLPLPLPRSASGPRRPANGRHHYPTASTSRDRRGDVVPLPADYAKRLHPDVPTGKLPAVLVGTASIAHELAA